MRLVPKLMGSLFLIAGIVGAGTDASGHPWTGRPAGPQEGTPQFRAEVSAVLVDVLVLDAEGQPVGGLTRDDFEIYEDGVRQAIDNFDVIDWTSYVAREAPRGERTVNPDASVNVFPRRFIFVLNRNRARFSYLARAKKAMESFVVESMADGDEALILDLGDSHRVLQQFTASKEQTIRTIRKISAMEANLYRGTGSDIGTRNIYQTLESLGQSLDELPGRKILLFLSPELAQTRNLLSYLKETVDAFNQSNTTIYSVDISGVRGTSADNRDLIDAAASGGSFDVGGLFSLANETGGRYYYNLNTFEPVLRKIGEENRRYYLLSYTPTNLEPDGEYRRIEVRVDRPGVDVIARRGYFADEDRAGRGAPERPSPSAGKDASPKKSDAPITGAAAHDRVPAGPTPPGSVEITTYLFPSEGPEVEVPIVVALPLDLVTADDPPGPRSLSLSVIEDTQGEVASFRQEVDARQFFAIWNPKLLPGLYLLQLTLSAPEEEIYQASTGIEVPEGFGDRFGFSSVVPVFPPETGEGGQRTIALRPTPTIRQSENAYMFFRVLPGRNRATVADDTELSFTIYEEDREVQSGSYEEPLRLSQSNPAGFPVLLKLPTDNLPPGAYRIELRIESPSSGRRAVTELQLTVQ